MTTLQELKLEYLLGRDEDSNNSWSDCYSLSESLIDSFFSSLENEYDSPRYFMLKMVARDESAIDPEDWTFSQMSSKLVMSYQHFYKERLKMVILRRFSSFVFYSLHGSTLE